MHRRSAPRPRLMTLLRVALVLVTTAPLWSLAFAPAAEAAPAAADVDYVSVIEVSGLLDQILVDFIHTELQDAEAHDATALVLQLNSPGAVVSDAELDALVAEIEASPVPVAVWVGPSG